MILKRVGVEKARARLEESFRNLELLRDTNTFAQFEVRWFALLVAMHSAFEILTRSAKGNNKSYRWASQLISDRKRDPLLQYLWQARNANEHGIEHVVRQVSGGFAIPMPASGALHIESLVVEDGRIKEFKGHGFGAPVSVEVYPDQIILVPVTNQGIEFPVPQTHLGKSLKTKTPTGIALAGLEYLTAKFAEAEALTI